MKTGREALDADNAIRSRSNPVIHPILELQFIHDGQAQPLRV
jgi:hypothetical protein